MNEEEYGQYGTPTNPIRNRVEMLGAVFNRKVTEQLYAVFEEVLTGYPAAVISKAFNFAESSLQHFPTPKQMKQLCNEHMPGRSYEYDFTPAEFVDETGKRIKILIDPNPSCAMCRDPKSFHPTKTCRQYGVSGVGRDTEMFKAEDCLEGRALLGLLKGKQ